MVAQFIVQLLSVAIGVFVVVEALPTYTNCAGNFASGSCNGQPLATCSSNVMGASIASGNGALISSMPTIVTEGETITITLSASNTRVAYAEKGSFSGDVCPGAADGALLRSQPGVGTSLSWTAPTGFTGSVQFVFIQTAFQAQGQITRTLRTVDVIAAASGGDPTPNVIEFQSKLRIERIFTFGDRVAVVSNDNAGMFLHSFTSSNGAPDITAVSICSVANDTNILSGITDVGNNPLYDGILGENGFDSNLADPAGQTIFDDLLFGNGVGTYQFIKKPCDAPNDPTNCCNEASGTDNALLTIEVATPAPSPAPSAQPTSSPTPAFNIATVIWGLPYTGPSELTVQSGDRLTFDIIDFSHNIIEITSKVKFDACDDSGANLIRDGVLQNVFGVTESVVFDESDVGRIRWFTCNRTAQDGQTHCQKGQVLTVRINARQPTELLTWNNQAGSTTVYALGKEYEPGTTVLFQYNPATHNLLKFPNKAAFDACDFSDAETMDFNEFSNGAFVRLGDEVGETSYYGCNVGSHCEQGQKVEFTIVEPEDDDPASTPPLDPGMLLIIGAIAVVAVGALAGVLFIIRRRRSGPKLAFESAERPAFNSFITVPQSNQFASPKSSSFDSIVPTQRGFRPMSEDLKY